MRNKLRWLLAISVLASTGAIVIFVLSTTPNATASEPAAGPISFEKPGTLQEAAMSSGIQLLSINSVPEQLTPRPVNVTKHRDTGESRVQRSWTDPNSEGGISLFQDNSFSELSGGRFESVGGKDGMLQVLEASDGLPPRFVFSWDGESGTNTVFAMLEGRVTQTLVENFVSAISVE